MRNQFFYTRKVEKPVQIQGQPTQYDEYRDSFNINKVIRSVTHTDGTVIIILDDFNERVIERPDIDVKSNKMKGIKKIRETVQSEIVLSKEDGSRFFDFTNIENV